MKNSYLVPLLIVLCAACSTTPEPKTAQASVQESALDKRLDIDRIVILAQPSAADIESLRQEGVNTIINVRTEQEMKDLALTFDEVQLASELDLDYIHSPIGGESGWSPKAVDALAQAVNNNKGKVLLHCASGGRAGMVYAAYAVKYLNVSPLQALQQIAPTGAWPLSLEKLSGIPLTVERLDQQTTTDSFESVSPR